MKKKAKFTFFFSIKICVCVQWNIYQIYILVVDTCEFDFPTEYTYEIGPLLTTNNFRS